MKRILIFIIVFVILSAFAFFWWKNGLTAVDPTSKKQIIFVVQKGEGVRKIANNLKREDLIKDPIVFFLNTRFILHLDKQIQAGDFRLSPSMSSEEIATNLTHGTLDIWVTIPEGKRAEEIADILKTNLPTYQESWREMLKQNEGYLFPDTYLIPKDADVITIVSLMKNIFEAKYATVASNRNTSSKDKTVIIASLIEREAKFQKDRPLVASVILNRLSISMPLQIDATIQYALGFQPGEKSWWKKALTKGDLKIDSPYNTYLNTGLPPTPISNPGFETLNAVVNSANTDYLYYLSDKSGNNHYAETLEQHNQNIKKYGL